ncbi:MAG: sulfotransferase family 2 domain-containing protein [Candidatus Thiodiazotropha sp.]
MIISDQYQFVFIHIPKNAGMEVRSLIQYLDETKGSFTNRIEQHPVLGDIDYVHLPLGIIERYFKNEYEKILNYKTFAIVRDPAERFVSSFSQHLRQTGKKPIHKMTRREQVRELQVIVDKLRRLRSQEILPYELVHFTPQCDYIFNGDNRIVDKLFLTNEMDKVEKYISTLLGKSVAFKEGSRANPTYCYKNIFFRVLFESFRPIYRLLKDWIPERILMSVRNLVFKKGSNSYIEILNNKVLLEFVHDYYQKDFEIYFGFEQVANGVRYE